MSLRHMLLASTHIRTADDILRRSIKLQDLAPACEAARAHLTAALKYTSGPDEFAVVALIEYLGESLAGAAALKDARDLEGSRGVLVVTISEVCGQLSKLRVIRKAG